MNQKAVFFGGMAAFAVFVVVMLQSQKYSIINAFPKENIVTYSIKTEGGSKDSQMIQKFIEQRNDVSKKLNEMKKKFGQLSCRQMELRRKAGEQVNDVSENGGWCAEISGSSSKSHVHDVGLAKKLSKFFKGKHVASFGDGPGDYKRLMDEYKEVASYTAFDGAPFCEDTTEGRVNFLDLSGPQYGLEARDWVISLEVAEHIPQKFEEIYLDNVANHAKEGIVLSWAVPGQGGLSHVNNQPLTHVVEQLKKRGFEMVEEPGKQLRAAAGLHWLKKNIYVYKRTDPKSFNPLNA